MLDDWRSIIQRGTPNHPSSSLTNKSGDDDDDDDDDDDHDDDEDDYETEQRMNKNKKRQDLGRKPRISVGGEEFAEEQEEKWIM